MQSKRQMKSDIESIIGAVVTSRLVGQELHRVQSATLVAQTLMSAIGKIGKKQMQLTVRSGAVFIRG
jgi:hypothetical protein